MSIGTPNLGHAGSAPLGTGAYLIPYRPLPTWVTVSSLMAADQTV